MAINAHTVSAETTEYIDPETGKFSSHPPEGTEPITRTQSVPIPEPKEKLSPLPGGGVIVETPEARHDDN